MAKESHALSHILGQRLVSSHSPPERRKSEAELQAMSIESRLLYERDHPLSDAEKQEALEREDRDAFCEMTGEVDHQDLLDNYPPSDWGA